MLPRKQTSTDYRHLALDRHRLAFTAHGHKKQIDPTIQAILFVQAIFAGRAIPLIGCPHTHLRAKPFCLAAIRAYRQITTPHLLLLLLLLKRHHYYYRVTPIFATPQRQYYLLHLSYVFYAFQHQVAKALGHFVHNFSCLQYDHASFIISSPLHPPVQPHDLRLQRSYIFRLVGGHCFVHVLKYPLKLLLHLQETGLHVRVSLHAWKYCFLCLASYRRSYYWHYLHLPQKFLLPRYFE